MTHIIRVSVAALVLVAGCSRSSTPALSDELKQDLAKAGGSDVQLTGSVTPRLDIVSASERMQGPVPKPKATAIAKAPSLSLGRSSASASPRRETPAAGQSKTPTDEVAPAEVPQTMPPAAPVPSAGRPQAPVPSTQREPRGGWRTPGEVIRRAPFPINP